jgi:hypothetical protein
VSGIVLRHEDRCRSCTPPGKGYRDIEHIGSAYDETELEMLKTVVRQWIAAE